jgi:hypothetical protein
MDSEAEAVTECRTRAMLELKSVFAMSSSDWECVEPWLLREMRRKGDIMMRMAI